MNVSIEMIQSMASSAFNGALRLRYAVFTLEGGDARYAVEGDDLYLDDTDKRNPHLAVASTDQGAVVGTLRLTMRKNGPFIADRLYRFDVLCPTTLADKALAKGCVALIDRVVVRHDFRQQGIFTQMLASSLSCADAQGASVVVMAVSDRNSLMQETVTRWQWQSYPVFDAEAGWRARHFYRSIAS